jgi:AraC-like DNA-binding protein
MPRLREKTEPPRGLLRPQATASSAVSPIALARFESPADLAAFVEHLWIVRWDARASGPTTRETLPHPSIHWAIEHARNEIFGIARGRFTREVRGQGRVVAAKFRPGGFCAFVRTPMHELTGRVLPASKLLGRRVSRLAKALRSCEDQEAALMLCDALRELEPRADEAAQHAERIVNEIATQRGITRVAQVCDAFQLAPLALQRLLRSKVGVSPKWLIQRYRLHEAVARIHAEGARDVAWAALAAELGFTDQAHFARTFKAFIGMSPGRYARQPQAPGQP